MHGIDQITQMDIFYHAMTFFSKGIIDVAYCGAFKKKSFKEANQLIEDLTKSNYRAPFETSGSNSRLRGGGIIELNKMSAIKAMSNQERRNQSAHQVETVEGGGQKSILIRDLLMRVPIKWRKLSLSMVIGDTTLSLTPTFQPTTHQH